MSDHGQNESASHGQESEGIHWGRWVRKGGGWKMPMAKKKIFEELMEGVDAMKKHREGKLTLRSHKVEVTALPEADAKFIRETRKRKRRRLH